jgi:hypothetical protein
MHQQDGDYNRDGTVDARDYDVWRGGFGSKTNPEADGNQDGVIDVADYVVWRARFSGVMFAAARPQDSSGTAPSDFAVPEASNSTAILVVIFAAAYRRRRFAKHKRS